LKAKVVQQEMLNNIDEYPLEAHEQAEKNKIVITR
jgi:hypothetical protein